MHEVLDILAPGLGHGNVQSICWHASSWIVLHNGSIMQRYQGGELVSEKLVTGGGLIHPNDVASHGENLLVCDAGASPPVIKLVDPVGAKVLDVWTIGTQGWRTASVALDQDDRILTVAVQDLPVAQRTRLLVSIHDSSTGELIDSFRCPTERAYSQGCTVIGSHMYLNTNDGELSDSATVLDVDLTTRACVDRLEIEKFVETEGLDGVWLESRPHLVTATRTAAYAIEVPWPTTNSLRGPLRSAETGRADPNEQTM
jgi:hypothetical protein